METFGASAPLKELEKKFGFVPESIVDAARAQIARARRRSRSIEGENGR
jgi:transketolase